MNLRTFHVRRTDDTDWQTIEAWRVEDALIEFYRLELESDVLRLEARHESEPKFRVYTVEERIEVLPTDEFVDADPEAKEAGDV